MASRGNSLTERRMQKRQEEEYQRRLKNVKGQIDLTPPRDSMSLQLQLGKMHAEQERHAAIDKQNLVIIERLTDIKKSPGRVDHDNSKWKPSNDRLKTFRDRKQRRIDQENKMLHERVQKVESYYDADEWEKDYKKHQYYLSMMENTTKDYDSVEYDDDDFENNKSSDEDDKESLPPVPPATPEKKKQDKKSSDEEDNVSLPPIDDKKSTGKGDDSDSYSEQVALMDAEELRAAIGESNKDKILEILGRTSEKANFQKLCDKYKELYDKDLMEDLESQLDEDVQSFLKSLAAPAGEEDAKKLNEAMKGLGTDEDAIIEILSTRNNKELAAIRQEYKKQFEQSLEEDLKGDTSGDVEKIFVELSKGQRDDADEVDKSLCKKDAKDLVKAGVGSWGTDEQVFLRVFTQRSLPQLAATYPEYKKLTKVEIEESIDKEMDGDLQKTFLAIVKYSRDAPGAQADKLSKALKDGDTAAVARIVLPMDKANLAKLCPSYKKTNKAELAEDVDKKCSGDLKQMLLVKLGIEADKKKELKSKKDNSKGKAGKNADKLPPVGKKKEQEKKPEKKQEKKTDKESKQEEDTSEKDADEMHQAIQDKNKDKIIDILVKNCGDKKKLQKLQDKYNKDHDADLLDAIKTVLDDDDLQDPLDCLFLPATEYDVKCLYEATKGLGTDENLLIQIICTRNNSDLAAIQESYKTKYTTTLESDIKGDTSGDFEDLLLELLKGKRDESDKVDKVLAKKDAAALIKAGAKTIGTDEDTFISVLTKRNPAQLNATFAEYKKLAKVEIEESIENEMTGDLEKGLVAIVTCIRNSSQLSSGKLQSSLQDGDTNTAARIILTSDKAKLTEIMSAYKKANDKTLDADVDKKCSENLKRLLLAKMGKGKDDQQQKGNQGKGKEKGKPSSKASPVKKQTDPNQTKKDDDTTQLHKAIVAEDKKKIKEIVVRNGTEKTKLKKLADDYKKQHGQLLLEALDSKVDDDILEAITVLLLPPSQADARALHTAMKGVGTSEASLIDILCTRNNAEIDSIKKDYSKKYGKSLEDDIRSETSGDFEKLLVGLLQGKRDESSSVNDDQAHKDAETLIEAGIKKWGTDEDKFIEIFTTRSVPQLRAMLPEYTKWAKCDIEESIKSEMDGDIQDGLLAVVSCVRDPVKTQTAKLNTALQDGDTVTLARIIAGTNEASLKEIESSYNTNYKPKLFFEVDKKCSPELKKIILPKLKDKTKDKPPGKKTQKAGDSNKQKGKEDECTQLHTAIEKKDKRKIKEIVLKNATETTKMKKLAENYNKRYEKDLVDELDSKMDDDLHEAITAMLLPPTQADARTLYYAMKGNGTMEFQLIQILCTRNNEKINAVKTEYRKKYGRSLEEDVKGDTSGDFEELLTALLKGKRDESIEVIDDDARHDANTLYKAGVKTWGTDEDKFIEILTTRSNAHLQTVLAEYKTLSGGVELQDSIKDEMDGDLRDGLLMLLSCVQDASKAQADNLHTALHDGDTSTVARIIAGTDQKAISVVESSYNSIHDPKIYFEVDKKCSEDLKKIILSKLKDRSKTSKSVIDNKQPPKNTSQNGTTRNIVKQGNSDTAQQQEPQEDTNKDRPKLDIKKVEYHGTVLAVKDFDAGKDAEKLKKAMKGFGNDEDAIISILTACSAAQRQQIVTSFKQQYDKDLVEELKSELSGKFEDAVVGLMSTPAMYDTNSLNAAMKGLGTQESLLVEILCTRSNKEIQEIKNTYRTVYGKDLTEAVREETSGDFCTLLVALLQGKRGTSESIDEDAAYKDAERLIEAGEKKWGTDESVFIDILTTTSSMQLRAILDAYKNVSQKDILESINDELEGDVHDAMRAIVMCARHPPEYFAESLHDALSGITSNSTMVTRIIITRSELDLVEIKSTFQDKYGKSLATEVKDELKGDHEMLLLKLLVGE